MKLIKIDLSSEFKEIEIIPFADQHWSDPNSDHDKVKADIEYVLERDNRF